MPTSVATVGEGARFCPNPTGQLESSLVGVRRLAKEGLPRKEPTEMDRWKDAEIYLISSNTQHGSMRDVKTKLEASQREYGD